MRLSDSPTTRGQNTERIAAVGEDRSGIGAAAGTRAENPGSGVDGKGEKAADPLPCPELFGSVAKGAGPEGRCCKYHSVARLTARAGEGGTNRQRLLAIRLPSSARSVGGN